MIEAGKGLNSVIGLFARFITGLVCTDLLSAIGPAVSSPDYSNDCRPAVPGTACQQGYEYIGRSSVQSSVGNGPLHSGFKVNTGAGFFNFPLHRTGGFRCDR